MFEKRLAVEYARACGESLKDFPLPVSLVDPDLRSTEYGGRVCGLGGEDIFFSEPDAGVLDHEIEDYDPAAGRLKAWVRIPSFCSGGNTVLCLSCGEPAPARTNRPAAVWDDDYRLVIHDASTGSPRDSSSHANDVRAEKTADGERWVRVADTDAVHVTEALTVEAWVESSEARAEAVESLISKWASPAGFDTFDAFDAGNTDGLDSKGFLGAAFDGRYIYCSAWEKGDGETTNIKGHGNFLRYDTAGDHGAFSLRYCDVGHNGGLCAALLGARFIINTEEGVRSVSANRPPASGRHHVVGTYDGRALCLYLDGELAGQQAASGRIVSNDIDLVVGRILNGAGHFRGRIEEIRVSGCARSAEWIRTQYRLWIRDGRHSEHP